MPTADFLAAAYPLFEASQVDLLEWSFDTVWNGAVLPDWAADLINFYASQGRLLGHGVFFSLLSGQALAHEQWLSNLSEECRQYKYLHISEHYGFSQAGSFVDSTQLPVPSTASTLALGLARMQLVAQAVPEINFGLENLAFAFSASDALAQGPFLKKLLTSPGNFLVLDIHNLYCQAHNFKIDFEQLLLTYPLELVKQIHISGGSWSEYKNLAIRRDTHDDEVPEELFQLLALALKLCTNVESVILERLGGTINGGAAASIFRDDFYRLKTVVNSRQELSYAGENQVETTRPQLQPGGLEQDLTLALYQERLLAWLNSEMSSEHIIARLKDDSNLSIYREYISTFEPRMVDVAKQLVQRWGKTVAQLESLDGCRHSTI